MLDLFCDIGEIEKNKTEKYKLSIGWTLYKQLKQELGE